MSPREPGRRNIGAWIAWTPGGHGRLCFRWPLGRTGRIYRITVNLGRDQVGELERVRDLIGAEIRAGIFVPEKRFPSAFAPRIAVDAPIERRGLVERMRAWIDDREVRKVRLSRTRGYRSHLANYVTAAPMLAAADLAALTSVEVLAAFQTWLVSRAGEKGTGLSEKTAANVIRGTLRAFARDMRLPLDAFDALAWERYAPTAGQDPFTAAERDAILAWFRGRRSFAEYVSIELRFLGITPSEVRGLNVGDFERASGTVQIVRSRHLRAEGATKTSARARIVPLGPVAADVATLAGIRGRREPLLAVAEDTLRDAFNRCLASLGYRPRALYQTKHTYATLALLGGAWGSEVASHLGISITTLEKHYARALQSGRLLATHGNATNVVSADSGPVSVQRRRKNAK